VTWLDLNELDRTMGALDASLGSVDSAVAMPNECYTSETFYAFERLAVFERSWLGLGRVEQIPEPGDYFTLSVSGEPLVVIRDTEGEINVLSNVCAHRNHLVAQGDGHVGHLLICPLHGWAYGLDGRLVNATQIRDREVFDRPAHCLPALRVEIWNGFIFASHDPDVAPLAPTLAKLNAYAEPYHLDQLRTTPITETPVLPWNWKTMFENGLEPLHTHFLHHGLHDFAPWPEFLAFDDGDGQIMHPTRFREIDQGYNPLNRSLLPILPDLDEHRRSQVMFAAVPPTLYLGFLPDHVFWSLYLPEGPTSMRIRGGLVVHPSARDIPEYARLIDWVNEGQSGLFAQDAGANTSVQLGRASRYARRGPYAREETTLPQWNSWIAQRYRSAYEDLLARELGQPRLVPLDEQPRSLRD
jgi:phenylpropionate dioxygenase-like ring-hydroxylating dioxygenase large terminal subunit